MMSHESPTLSETQVASSSFTGVAQLEQAVPEVSAIGESQSNGRAESSVLRIQHTVRTYRCALESKLETRIPCNHPVFSWFVEHAASRYNRYVCTEEGSTPYQNLHGQKFKGRAIEFGETVFYYAPKRLRSKMSLRWRLGVFVGNHQNSNEALVAASNGDIIKVRSVVGVVQPSRWSKEMVMNIKGNHFVYDLIQKMRAMRWWKNRSSLMSTAINTFLMSLSRMSSTGRS
mgnify:CR=1 FL=1